MNKAMELYATGNYNKKELAELLSLGSATIRRWIGRTNGVDVYTNSEIFLSWVGLVLCKELKHNQVMIMESLL